MKPTPLLACGEINGFSGNMISAYASAVAVQCPAVSILRAVDPGMGFGLPNMASGKKVVTGICCRGPVFHPRVRLLQVVSCETLELPPFGLVWSSMMANQIR